MHTHVCIEMVNEGWLELTLEKERECMCERGRERERQIERERERERERETTKETIHVSDGEKKAKEKGICIEIACARRTDTYQEK